MSVCSDFAAKEAQQQILIVQTTICLNTTNTTIAFCAAHHTDANDGNVRYELCAELCAAGFQADFGWSDCLFNIP